jgi:hypothetical protein
MAYREAKYYIIRPDSHSTRFIMLRPLTTDPPQHSFKAKNTEHISPKSPSKRKFSTHFASSPHSTQAHIPSSAGFWRKTENHLSPFSTSHHPLSFRLLFLASAYQTHTPHGSFSLLKQFIIARWLVGTRSTNTNVRAWRGEKFIVMCVVFHPCIHIFSHPTSPRLCTT